MTQEETKKFKIWQWRTILGTMIGYAVFYFVRKNFSFAIPGLTAEYGISKTTFGLLMTIVGLIYGLSKFVNGVLADRLNGRWHMTTGLAVCSVVNLVFGAGAIISALIVGETYGPSFINTLVIIFGVLMVLNNLFQGCGFPPCNRLITHWVPPHELATKMSIWNASHSIGAFIIAVLCGYIMGNMGTDMTGNEEVRARIVENTAKITENMDPAAAQAYVDNALQHVGAWQWAFWIPAIIGLFGVLFIITVLRDTPKSVGLPELAGTKTELDGKEETSAEFKEFLRKKVFMNPIIWILAISDFFVYIVRFAILDWGPTFLQESRGLSSEMAGWTVAIFEVMGVCGMLLAGVISDKLFKGRSQRTCVFCMAGVLIFISLFVMLPETTNPTLLLAFLAISGFFIYGPQALIGVIASNQATKKAASTANGVVGFVSYISVAVSGVGFGFISDHFGWQWVFITMIIIAVLGLLALLTLWNVKSDGYDHDDEVAAEVKSMEEVEAVSAE